MLSVGESLSSFARESSLHSSGSSTLSAVATRSADRVAASAVHAGGADQVGTERAGVAARDAGVKAYEQAAQKMAAGVGGNGAGGAGTTDAQTTAEIARLKASDAAVRAHEAAHVAAGGSYVRGAASFTFQQGPDGKQYAIGGEVGIDVSPVPGNPQATISKMITVRAAALAPSDPSAADRAVAAAASQAEAAARAELSGSKKGDISGPQSGGTTAPELPDVGQVAAQITAAQGQQVQAAYGAFAPHQTSAEPSFAAAA